VEVAAGGVAALRDAGRFLEARDAVRKAVQQYSSEPDARKLRDLEMSIRDEVRCFITMKADIEQLSASDRSVRDVAVQHLLCEEVGRIVLRQTVREGAVASAISAGRGLAEVKDAAGIQAVLARAKSEPDVDGATGLMAILPDVSGFVAVSELPALSSWTAGKPASARLPVQELMKRRAVGALDAAELAILADLAVGPDTPVRRGSAEFLAMVFMLKAKRDPDAFDQLCGTGRYSALLASVEKDRTAGDSQLAAWARRQWPSLLRIDRDALSRGLYARWTLDTLGMGQFNDSGPSSRNLNAKNLGPQSVVPGILGRALLCTNENAAVEWGNHAYRALQTNDHSIAAWINVVGVKPTWDDPESVVIGSDVNGGRTGGLILGTNGILNVYVPVHVLPAPAGEPQKRPGKRVLEYIHVASPQPLTTNRWYHVAVAVRRSANEVTLYVNGDIVARQALSTDATPYDSVSSLRVGSARGTGKERRSSCVFQGIVDDVRIYDRVITDTDAGMLFAQGETDQ
jgi:hypothetical protein